MRGTISLADSSIRPMASFGRKPRDLATSYSSVPATTVPRTPPHRKHTAKAGRGTSQLGSVSLPPSVMADAVCNSFSYRVLLPLLALRQMVGDKMGNHRRFLAEVESPYFILGGVIRLHQSRVLAHVLGPGSDQEGLEVATRIGHVAKDAPVAGAITAADAAQLPYRPVELL